MASCSRGYIGQNPGILKLNVNNTYSLKNYTLKILGPLVYEVPLMNYEAFAQTGDQPVFRAASEGSAMLCALNYSTTLMARTGWDDEN